MNQSVSLTIFTTAEGDKPSCAALRYQTQCACRDAGAYFCHTFAPSCYYKGMDVKILSKLLGHADVNITYNLYIHLYGDGFDEMYEALVGNG